MVTCLRTIIIGIFRHSTEPANTHSMTDTAIPHIGPTVYLLGQASFQRRRMQRLNGDFQVIDKIMRITFPDLDIEAGLAMLIAADEVVPRETADIAFSTAKKIVGGTVYGLMIGITTVREGKRFFALRNSIVDLLSPCTSFITIGHDIAIKVDLKIIITVKRIIYADIGT